MGNVYDLKELFAAQRNEINAPVYFYADYAMIYEGNTTTEHFKAGNILCFRNGVNNEDFSTNDLLFLAKVTKERGKIQIYQIGRIKWREYDFIFTPVDEDITPIISPYCTANVSGERVMPIARAVGFMSEL